MPEQVYSIGRRITLPGHFAEPVTLESVCPLGDGFECRVRLQDGTPDEAPLSREEATTVFGQQAEAPTSIKPADAESIRLLVESSRIRLAYTHDRHFAVSLSGIRTLPHQIEADEQRLHHQARPNVRTLPHLPAPETARACRSRTYCGVAKGSG